MRQAILLPSKNWALGATVSLATGAASASHPLANVHDGDVGKPFKADAAGAVRIVFDCGTAKRVDGFFKPMSNIPAATAGVLFEGHTANAWGAPDVSVPVVIPAFFSMGATLAAVPDSPWASLLADYPNEADRTKQFWSVYCPSIGVALAIGEILFGELELFDDLFIQGGYIESASHASIVKPTAFGSPFALRYPVKRRSLEVTLGLDDSTRATLRTLVDETGSGADPSILVPDLSANVGLWGQWSEIPFSMLTGNAHQAPATFVECNRGLPL